MTTKEATPMMAQYLGIKREYPDCLLFYRMGDFYELFFDDAIKAAQALDIALTKRGLHEGQDIPMCGVPVHSHQAYLHKLVRQGFRIAVCEQMEDPEEARKRGAKGPLKREVIRVITAGTITEDGLLDARGNNHLLALSLAQGEIGLAWVDISTGDFWASSCGLSGLAGQLARINPGEIIFPDKLWGDEEYKKALGDWSGVLSPQPGSRFDSTNAKIRLENFYEIKALDALGAFSRAEIAAAGALLDYIELTQKGRIPRLETLKRQEEGAVLQIDAATRRNLELTRTMNGEKKGSLLGLMDKTLTGGGARLLGQYFAAPLTAEGEINARLDGVEFFIEDSSLRGSLRDKLRSFPDVERALARISLGRGGPRDLALVRDSLLTAPQIQGLFDGKTPPTLLAEALAAIRIDYALVAKLKAALLPELPLLARDGGFIAPGFHPPLDELKGAKNESERLLAVLQNRYAEKTGISNLKIRHNNLIGYHIEIPSKQAEKIGPEFIHRQSMVNAVRYSTPELVELENRIRGADQKALGLELQLFEELIAEVRAREVEIAGLAKSLAVLDVMAGFALLACNQEYCRPQLSEGTEFNIQEGRHPVVEAFLGKDFIPNSCDLSRDNSLWLLTGPNMAGKSTFLRQNALILIMAQMGSFVPAQSAHIGVADRLFSRVGASDDLARGRSTFMVEMVEAATILNQATPKSLVILDEIGRGTATFDGLSIAWAVVEHLHDKIQARALFATHYHELTALAARLSRLSCHSMKVKEWKKEVIFLHEVGPGNADRSYGVHVAALAGLPGIVVKRAEEILDRLEKSEQTNVLADLPLFSLPLKPEVKALKPSLVEERLKEINPDELAPKAALELIYELKSLAAAKE